MSLRKLRDLARVCRHPSHNPPSHMVYEDGVWEWTCPSCGHKTVFTVSKPFLGVETRRCSGRSRDGSYRVIPPKIETVPVTDDDVRRFFERSKDRT